MEDPDYEEGDDEANEEEKKLLLEHCMRLLSRKSNHFLRLVGVKPDCIAFLSFLASPRRSLIWKCGRMDFRNCIYSLTGLEFICLLIFHS